MKVSRVPAGIIFCLILFCQASRMGAAAAAGSSADLGQTMKISESGVLAQKLQMEIIAANIANIGTTRTASGDPYRRKIALLTQAPGAYGLGGVTVAGIVEDAAPGKKVYNPAHPDADSNGYVTMPNVDLATEMVALTYTSKLYEANVAVFNASKQMMQMTMELGR